MVLEPGQPLEGLKSGVKRSVNWGLWGKFLTPLWAPGAELGSQQETMIDQSKLSVYLFKKRNSKLYCRAMKKYPVWSLISHYKQLEN